jgi:hypothetical protein
MNDPSTELSKLLCSSYLENNHKEEQIIGLKKELEATKRELEATATKLTQAESIITAKFNVKESVMSLLDTEEDDSFSQKNHVVIEKHPCGRVQFSITETKELNHLRGTLKEKEDRLERNENLIFLLQTFLKELRTSNNDELIRNMTKEEFDFYLKGTGWDAELCARSVTGDTNEMAWYLVEKEKTTKMTKNKDSSDKKRARKFI